MPTILWILWIVCAATVCASMLGVLAATALATVQLWRALVRGLILNAAALMVLLFVAALICLMLYNILAVVWTILLFA